MKLNTWLVFGIGCALISGTSLADGGADLYTKNCKRCHEADGSGKKDGVPSKIATALKLKDPEVLNLLRDDAKKLSDADIEKIILKGKEKMKPMEEKVTADEAKILAQYVRTLQSAKK